MLTPGQKKWRLLRTYLSGHPIWCAWQVTYRCNFRCLFCPYWAQPSRAEDEPGIQEYADAARKLARLGTLMVSLAGGEPLLRRDLTELVRAVGRYHFPFLTTNGWLATPQLADDLMAAGLWGASVSIDYADPARHDRRRGVRGAWKKAWQAVEMLSDARKHPWQRVNVLAVLMDDNIDQMEPLIKMAAERDAYFMVQCYGFRKTGSNAYAHHEGPVGPRLLALRHRYANFLSNPHYLGRFDRFLRGGIAGCRAGRAFFNIDSNGDIAICVEEKDHPVGNLHRHNLWTLRRRLADAARGNTCRDCWYNCRGEVECLYRPAPLLRSLPTLLFDRGKAVAPGRR